jgi:hypothetical protein
MNFRKQKSTSIAVRVNTQTRIGFTEEAIALRNALKCFHEFIQQYQALRTSLAPSDSLSLLDRRTQGRLGLTTFERVSVWDRFLARQLCAP